MQSTEATVTVEDVRRVAELAHLDMDADEQQRMLKDLNAVLGHIAQLNEVDTANVEPMAAGIPALPDDDVTADSRPRLREDVPRPSLERAPVMAQAPETDGSFFKVPKVIER